MEMTFKPVHREHEKVERTARTFKDAAEAIAATTAFAREVQELVEKYGIMNVVAGITAEYEGGGEAIAYYCTGRLGQQCELAEFIATQALKNQPMGKTVPVMTDKPGTLN